MRKSTLVSLLVLCGSTAAVAQTLTPVEPGVQNNTSNTVANDMLDPAANTATDPMADIPEPAAPNATMANEANPPPR